MNVALVQRELSRFIARHRTGFEQVASSQSQILEISALAVAATHYQREGYQVFPENLRAGRFRVKLKSGYRQNFSWFCAQRDEECVEIHSNLSVQSAYAIDTGIYVVDVAVIRGRCRTNRGPGPRDEWIANGDLITFLEAKKLVAFPMLLAQFIGIVHEIKPAFLRQQRAAWFVSEGHFDPALVTIGHLARTSAAIRASYPDRGFCVNVIANFDTRISWLSRNNDQVSPLASDAELADDVADQVVT
jgi:hypothetical protein